MKKKRMRFLRIAVLCCLGAVLCGCTRKSESMDSLEELALVRETEQAQEIPEGSVPAEEMVLDAVGDEAADAAATAEPPVCYVYICGAVEHPGVYRMEADERVYAVIERAGGFRETACEDYVNQAKKIADGLKIWIPTAEEAREIRKEDRSGMPDGAGENAGLEYPAADGGSGVSAGQDGRVDINRAGKNELCTLTGIGEAKAQAIIAYRSEHGKFSKKEDIMNVAGIKQSGYEKIKDQITVNQE